VGIAEEFVRHVNVGATQRLGDRDQVHRLLLRRSIKVKSIAKLQIQLAEKRVSEKRPHHGSTCWYASVKMEEGDVRFT
jgi:hypothetical protein